MKLLSNIVLLCLLTLASSLWGANWTSLTPLPDGYAGQSLVYSTGYLYQAGGSSQMNGFADGTNVFYAQVHSDGTIGSWNSATPLPEGVCYHAGVTANGFVYVVGGLHLNVVYGTFVTNVVYYSKINSDGSLGTWNITTPLPQNLDFLSASVWNNTIYVVGGSTTAAVLSNVYSAQIQVNGTLSGWTTQTSLPIEDYSQAEAANGYLYALGGTAINGDILQSIYCTKINADGSLAGWNQTMPLPQPESYFGAITVNGLIFSVGGYNGTNTTSSFYSASVNGNGSLNPWLSGTSLPTPLYLEAVANNNSYVFYTGGQNNAGDNLSAVYSMALPTAPGAPSLTKSNLVNGTFNLRLTSTQTNTGFGLLASTNLTGWTNIGWGFTDTNGLLQFQDTNAASFPNRFYKAYWPLP